MRNASERVIRETEAPEATPSTYFAPAERAEPEALRGLANESVHDPLIRIILEAVSGYLLILDEHRQILAGNDRLLQALGITDNNDVIGLRPGELLHCENAALGPGGCGTSKKCRKCGAVLAILASQSGGTVVEGECSLTMENDGELKSSEFRVRCTPITLAGQRVTAFVLQDISAEKRRDVLEQVFMHDLRNVLQGLIGYSEIMSTGNMEVASHMILALSNQLNEEINGQDYLMRAERGELDVYFERVDAVDVMERVKVVFEQHPASMGKHLRILIESPDTHFESDGRLLRRVLVNMVKNAFEAVPAGTTVKLRFCRENGHPVFRAWNPGKIPDAVSARIFQRSFSTKGELGHGIGTYSMRLLSSQYLGAEVSFNTSEAFGTEFFIRLGSEQAAIPPGN